MKWIIAAALCAAVLASPVLSNAADLRVAPGARHVERGTNWRDRCAWARHYCLYAWNGYVYHYPWSDLPGSRRHRAF